MHGFLGFEVKQFIGKIYINKFLFFNVLAKYISAFDNVWRYTSYYFLRLRCMCVKHSNIDGILNLLCIHAPGLVSQCNRFVLIWWIEKFLITLIDSNHCYSICVCRVISICRWRIIETFSNKDQWKRRIDYTLQGAIWSQSTNNVLNLKFGKEWVLITIIQILLDYNHILSKYLHIKNLIIYKKKTEYLWSSLKSVLLFNREYLIIFKVNLNPLR